MILRKHKNVYADISGLWQRPCGKALTLWKIPKASFPPFSPHLQIQQRAPNSSISTATTAVTLEIRVARIKSKCGQFVTVRVIAKKTLRKMLTGAMVTAKVPQW